MAPTKNVHISSQQKVAMLDYMIQHQLFATGKLIGPLGNQKKDRMWEALSDKLNSMGTGATKDPTKWKNTWSDWKNKVKVKAGAIRCYMNGTGGGMPSTKELTPIEEKLLAFMGPELATGDPDIMELGFLIESETSVSMNAEEPIVDEPIMDAMNAVVTDVASYTCTSSEMGNFEAPASISSEVVEVDVGTSLFKKRKGNSGGSSERINLGDAKRRSLADETAYDRAAEKFEDIEEKRSETVENIAKKVVEVAASLDNVVASLEKISASSERQAIALEAIAAAKKWKYGLE